MKLQVVDPPSIIIVSFLLFMYTAIAMENDLFAFYDKRNDVNGRALSDIFPRHGAGRSRTHSHDCNLLSSPHERTIATLPLIFSCDLLLKLMVIVNSDSLEYKLVFLSEYS